MWPSQPPAYSETTDKGGQPDQMKEFVSAVLGSAEVQWTELFAQANSRYQPPSLVMFSGATSSACGFAQSAMGPFYCPLDRKVYLDTSFFEDMQRRFGACDSAQACQFSQAYVIAHEIGHHVQNLLGILPRLQQMQQGMDRADANRLQVMAELQADCFAGVWANHSQQKWRFLDPGDVETGAADGIRHWRRSAATADPGLYRARCFHARIVAAARPLVHHRAQVRRRSRPAIRSNAPQL